MHVTHANVASTCQQVNKNKRRKPTQNSGDPSRFQDMYDRGQRPSALIKGRTSKKKIMKAIA